LHNRSTLKRSWERWNSEKLNLGKSNNGWKKMVQWMISG
jgi:hypothetical protein